MRKTTSPVVDAVAKTGKWIVLIFFLIITFIPLLWLVISSFKTDLELINKPFLLPKVWQFQNYLRAFQLSDLHQLFLHSIIVSAAATALNILIASMASYALSRYQFGFNNLFQ